MKSRIPQTRYMEIEFLARSYRPRFLLFLHINITFAIYKHKIWGFVHRLELHQERYSKTSSSDNYLFSLKSKSVKTIAKFSTYNCTCICKDHLPLVCKLRLFPCVFDVFCVTHQCCHNRQGRFALIFREDSQIDFAKENVIFNISLRPLPPYACTLQSKTDN